MFEESDIFVGQGLAQLKQLLQRLPTETRNCVDQELKHLDQAQKQIDLFEKNIQEQVREAPTVGLLKSLPGFGYIFSALVAQELGSVDRFLCGEHFASYACCAPKVSSSGGKTHYGHLRQEANH